MEIQLDTSDATFKAFPHLNKAGLEFVTRSRIKLHEFADRFLTDDVPAHVLARKLAETRDIGPKEVLESFEFYARVRRRLRAPHVADLCCGHGLVGLLFATFERSVERVTLMDSRLSTSAEGVQRAVFDAAPWAKAKVTFVTSEAEEMGERLPKGTSVLGVHACGKLTDRCIDAAVALKSRVAVMPCCYGPNHLQGPTVFERVLDPQLCVDVDRTYRLEARGYEVDWQFIPRVITPRNRILIGMPRT